jgi:hypothetical protein
MPLCFCIYYWPSPGLELFEGVGLHFGLIFRKVQRHVYPIDEVEIGEVAFAEDLQHGAMIIEAAQPNRLQLIPPLLSKQRQPCSGHADAYY